MRIPAALLALLAAVTTANGAPVDYLKQIKPLLHNRCSSCHGALAQKAKLRLDTAALIRKGGRSGPVIIPGKSGESLVIDAVLGRDRPRMPPEKEGAALTPEQVALLKDWIDQGAPSPANEPTPEDPRRHWAFLKPVRPLVPAAEAGPIANPVDGFIAAGHRQHGLRPRPAADRGTLLRRVHLDLVGLPPTRAELHGFLADRSPDAYEKVVDRLLASPRYGERWGRHWMDVWRYSDWYGRRTEKDWRNSAPQIWRWRDWIVQSLNADKGYDRMIQEMLAADEIAPGDDASVVATGFLVRNFYVLNYNQWMRDIVEHTGKAFLGLTLNCCHCHDHKYDPITQEEYFKFRAFFEPLELRQDRVPGEPDPGPFEKYVYPTVHKVVLPGIIRVFDEKLDAPTFMYRLGDERDRIANRPPVAPSAPAALGGDHLAISPVHLPREVVHPGMKPFIQREQIEAAERALADARGAVRAEEGKLTEARLALERAEANPCVVLAAAPAALARRAGLRHAVDRAIGDAALGRLRIGTATARLAAVRAVVSADRVHQGLEPGDTSQTARSAGQAQRQHTLCAALEARAAAELALATARALGNPITIQKAEQGLTAANGKLEAAHKALAAAAPSYASLGPSYPDRSTGRRRALAGWIGSRDNPLTARVAVNHIWMRHFGRPLIESVFDFGRNGKRPSHPELLDWLAVDFMESGWSMKKLHRLLVTSRTYQLRSDDEDGNLGRDSDNRYLWRFGRRRVESEVLRDAMLHSAGVLDTAMGGPPIEGGEEATSRRRTLYFTIHPEEGGRLKLLEPFDAPDPCDCYRRTESLMPQQALVLTNSRFVLERSRTLARQLWSEVASEPAGAAPDEAFIVAAFEHLLTRLPSAAELAACREFLHTQADLLRPRLAGPAAHDVPARAREGLVRALFNHYEFLTMH
jgi:hypothetical protein